MYYVSDLRNSDRLGSRKSHNFRIDANRDILLCSVIFEFIQYSTRRGLSFNAKMPSFAHLKKLQPCKSGSVFFFFVILYDTGPILGRRELRPSLSRMFESTVVHKQLYFVRICVLCLCIWISLPFLCDLNLVMNI